MIHLECIVTNKLFNGKFSRVYTSYVTDVQIFNYYLRYNKGPPRDPDELPIKAHPEIQMNLKYSPTQRPR